MKEMVIVAVGCACSAISVTHIDLSPIRTITLAQASTNLLVVMVHGYGRQVTDMDYEW